MFDSDLADLYNVETKNLNKAVKRNIERFPEDFMFQVTEKEAGSLKFQSGTSNSVRGGRRTLPYVFTQEGISMLSGVLHSDRAIQVNVAIMRTFIKLQAFVMSSRELVQKLHYLEEKYDGQFKVIFDAIRALTSERAVPRRRVSGLNRKLE